MKHAAAKTRKLGGKLYRLVAQATTKAKAAAFAATQRKQGFRARTVETGAKKKWGVYRRGRKK